MLGRSQVRALLVLVAEIPLPLATPPDLQRHLIKRRRGTGILRVTLIPVFAVRLSLSVEER